MTLTQKRAEERFALIVPQSIRYKFHLILEPGTHYQGLSQIQFELKKQPEQLALDCQAKQVTSVIINGKKQQKFRHEQGFLYLNCQQLKSGKNHIAVGYHNKYDNDGNGCASFIDVDGKQYLYTQFQPYSANRVFALFDQPDLKAPMQLSVVSPMEWGDVLSNEYAIVNQEFNLQKMVEKSAPYHKDQTAKFFQKASGRMSVFPATKLLPTYLYCFVAGPYKKLQLKQTYKNIPMSLYCLESLYTYMQGMAPFVFQVTIQCMKFFESFFGVDYPFNKYDQVFAHQYRCGAMENAGIVTFNDQYIWKEKVSVETMLDLANTISHELSHHWFGNLSTMKWWDNLWLNESFAEFISHFCLEKVKNNIKTINYESSMAAFLGRKAWGYHEDQLVTTHPISGKVANTVVASSIFDGITYSKGAATMKQLLLLIGQQNFSKGVSSYFKKYGFKNATLQDFINQLQTYFKNQDIKLEDWKKIWLETASLNQLQPKWDPENVSENAELQILQTPFTQAHPTLRPHKIKIALFKQDCSFDVIQVLVKAQEKTSVKYNGANNYKAVLLNYEDHTFAKVNLDQASISFFSSGHLVKIKDTLTRTMIWRSFFDMVKDGIISSMKYIDIFQANIPNQKSDSIFETHFMYIRSAINIYTPKKYREELNSRIFYFILRLIPTIPQQQQNRLVILRSQLCSFTSSYLTCRILLAWRQGKYTPLKDHQMTIVQKWTAVTEAFAQKNISNEEKNALLKSQLQLDQSDAAKLSEATCKALISTEQQFEQLYKSFKDPANQKSVALKRAIISGWNHPYHEQRLKNYRKRYFDQVIQTSKVLQKDHFELFFENLLPTVDDNLQQTIDGLKTIKFGEEQKFDKNRTDALKNIGDLQRYLKAYKKFEEFSGL